MPVLLPAVEGTIEGGVELRFIGLKEEEILKCFDLKYIDIVELKINVFFFSITLKIEFNNA
jgi:hypothetical protein